MHEPGAGTKLPAAPLASSGGPGTGGGPQTGQQGGQQGGGGVGHAAADASASTTAQASPHVLALRVMRLSKPAFATSFPANEGGVEVSDLAFTPKTGAAGGSGDAAASAVAVAEQGVEVSGFGASSALVLPQAFGSIFLGESFACFLSVSNVLAAATAEGGVAPGTTAKNIRTHAELQTNSQKHLVLGESPGAAGRGGTAVQSGALAELSPGEAHDFVIEHEVTELGVHILIARIEYDVELANGSGSERRNFRKYFKFQVTNPIHFRTNIHDLQHGIFVTALVQNACPVPLFFESVKFDPAPLFLCRDCNGAADDDSNDASGGGSSGGGDEAKRRRRGGAMSHPGEFDLPTAEDVVFLKTNDVQQYLFQLLPKDPRNPATVAARELGKIDIVWRSQLGSKGRLQTAPLERRLPQRAEIELMFNDIPPHVTLERPFQVKASVTNRSPRAMKLAISFTPRSNVASPGGQGAPDVSPQPAQVVSHGIAHAGLSGLSIGQLAPGATYDFELSLFPLKPGVQKLAGVLVTDESAVPPRVYSFDECLELFVF